MDRLNELQDLMEDETNSTKLIGALVLWTGAAGELFEKWEARIAALEAAQQPITQQERAIANLWGLELDAPEPSAKVKTIPAAEWELTQERVSNAVNALWAIRRCAELDQPASRMFDLAREALDRDTEFEIALGM